MTVVAQDRFCCIMHTTCLISMKNENQPLLRLISKYLNNTQYVGQQYIRTSIMCTIELQHIITSPPKHQ